MEALGLELLMFRLSKQSSNLENNLCIFSKSVCSWDLSAPFFSYVTCLCWDKSTFSFYMSGIKYCKPIRKGKGMGERWSFYRDTSFFMLKILKIPSLKKCHSFQGKGGNCVFVCIMKNKACSFKNTGETIMKIKSQISMKCQKTFKRQVINKFQKRNRWI